MHAQSDDTRIVPYHTAQRHWMEITLHTPLSKWYVQTEDNDLNYWGLDYPPLTAYQSFVYGAVIAQIEPEAVALHTSRGYETYSSRLLMRWSALVSDLVFMLPGVSLFVYAFYASSHGVEATAGGGRSAGEKGMNERRRRYSGGEPFAMVVWALASLALSPAPILIDHGHFQYNGISLGLVAVWEVTLVHTHAAHGAAAAIVQGWDLVGSVLFCLALNHKQMSLYFAPAFFAHLLGKCLRRRNPAIEVTKLGAVVVATFAVVWAPFAVADGSGVDGILAVFTRLAPLQRGIYEDYVANFWCATAPLARWKHRFGVSTLARFALGATVLAASPSMAHQIARPSREGFVWCMANSAWAFFMFSFQVHEKSILLPLLPVTMLALRAPSLSAWMQPLACFSMWPLLQKDKLGVAYLGIILAHLAVLGGHPPAALNRVTVAGSNERPWRIVFSVTAIAIVVAHVAEMLVPPPPRLPYIHSLTFTSLGFVGFAGAAVYCNWRQWQIPTDEDAEGTGVAKPGSTEYRRRRKQHTD